MNYQIPIKCIQCSTNRIVRVPQAGFLAWRRGDLIQDAMPNLSASDRELLISGVCDTCFRELWKEESDVE